MAEQHAQFSHCENAILTDNPVPGGISLGNQGLAGPLLEQSNVRGSLHALAKDGRLLPSPTGYVAACQLSMRGKVIRCHHTKVIRCRHTIVSCAT